ncbi:hypothetical protein BNJ_00236 [Kaumoebavirus]|uniref:hypothetical protein n=1 Tax=Kaumoebavirus TaxID=1859492 RepID=UPI0009C2770A|nr:hypothetical protein BNJ_00236 [Kaumoebavirus]ARA72065.1 hypothetical protein BNJ_00236 [Kaumoebavirus]
MVLHVTLTGLQATSSSDQARYAEWLGHRLCQTVEMEVNGNLLDSYDADTYNFHYQFCVPKSKQTGWKRNVGQEVPKTGYLTQNPGTDTYRELKQYVDGPQTPRRTQGDVDMWIPLLFWFNQDPRLAINN